MKFNKLKSILISIMLILVIVLTPLPVAGAEDVGIASVEVTQVMGKGIDLSSGQYYFMNMFVADKPTAIQVVLTDKTKINPDKMSLKIYYEGSLLANAKPFDSGNLQIVTFIPSMASVKSWKAGRYKFVASINGETKTTEAIFNESRKFSLLLISASVMYDGKVYEAPELNGSTFPLSKQPLPISDNKAIRKFHNAKLSLGTGEGGYDISTPGGQSKLLADIEKYRIKSAPQYDVVACAVTSPLTIKSSNSVGETMGYTDSRNSIVLTLHGSPSLEAREATLLHELGHIFGNGDEYPDGQLSPDINGVPHGVFGTDNGKVISGTRSFLRHATDNDSSGILIHDVQNPFDPKTGKAMLNRSSFMGSGHQHWPTSMVWEQAYRYLVPNYNNVLPRVYTDGKIVASRPSENDLSDEELTQLKNSYRQMLNEVRKLRGLEPFKEDQIQLSGDTRLLEVANENLSKRNFGNIINVEPMVNSIRADTKHLFTLVQTEITLKEYGANRLESDRVFFTESPCGHHWIKADYFFLAFVRAGNITYFTWSTISGAYPNKDVEKQYVPQPETPPVPEVNPVTNKQVRPEDFHTPPPDSAAKQPDPPEHSPESATATPKPDPDNDPPKADKSPYSRFSSEERLELLNFDNFDYGSVQWGGRDYNIDYVLGFYSWYLEYAYSIGASASDIKQAIEYEFDKAAEAADGMGSEALVFDLICQYYELYPPQELREYSYWYTEGIEPIYGSNPARSTFDTDRIQYR